ncbi:MAG TPA: nitroreductase, partial [Gammaproteobacteria bacterium]|nr:nitroreductase [Gammaproteobacteria bacterium]
PQTSLGFHADAVREVLEVDASQKLLFGISFGYEDAADPINNTRMGRAPLAETTVFHDL